jgi:hypothetical protein
LSDCAAAKLFTFFTGVAIFSLLIFDTFLLFYCIVFVKEDVISFLI